MRPVRLIFIRIEPKQSFPNFIWNMQYVEDVGFRSAVSSSEILAETTVLSEHLSLDAGASSVMLLSMFSQGGSTMTVVEESSSAMIYVGFTNIEALWRWIAIHRYVLVSSSALLLTFAFETTCSSIK